MGKIVAKLFGGPQKVQNTVFPPENRFSTKGCALPALGTLFPTEGHAHCALRSHPSEYRFEVSTFSFFALCRS
jgi:hypothetical protein